MSNSKKFYWIKLKTDFFNLDEIDFLLSQKNGCEYIVLYQMICLKTANNGGRLCTQIGEMIIPFDVDKIVRDTKYFDFDTVTIALELFKKLGLVYEQEDSVLKIANFDKMVGSETQWAERKRVYREKQLQIEDNVQSSSEDKNRTLSDKSIENRDKSLDIRDKSIDIEKEKELIDNIKYIVDNLNQKAGTHYRYTTPKTQKALKSLLTGKQPYTVQDCITVIDKKCADWIGTEWEQYLRPSTLFGSKFESYLNAHNGKKSENESKDFNSTNMGITV